ncbi:HNH endonuclease family protein [Halomicronema sp. CCY15110]|uniref:HNH endonuclease family protein n=1 Tax=Halomicronema sp. CCY15110 TaxID=2767773 RepID=UPI00194F5A2A
MTEESQLKQKVQQRLKQAEDVYDKVPARNRVLFAVRDDGTFFEKYVLPEGSTLKHEHFAQITKDEDQAISVRIMSQAILDMHDWWNQRLSEEKESQTYIANFFTYLSNRVLLLFLSTPDNLDDAYNLFTVLNSRGMQLSSGDILRAQNLRVINDESRRYELAKKWDSCVDVVQEPLSNFDELLKYIVLAKIRFTSDKTRNLKSAFDYLIDKDEIVPGEGFFDLISRYSQHFNAVSNPQKLGIDPSEVTDFENIYFILSETFGGQFIMPLIHYRERFGSYRILDFLIKLDNLASMAWLMGRRTLQQRLFILIRAMDDAITGDGSTSQRADRFLEDERLDYGYKYFRSKTDMKLLEFSQLLKEEQWGTYGGSKVNKSRYLLLKLDFIHGNEQTRLSFNRAASTLEHILPRSAVNKNEEDTYEIANWVHRLGNLVLLDRKKNSSLSNADFETKIQRYKGNYETRPYTNHVFMTHEQWTLNELRNQHDYAVNMLIEYYRLNSLSGLRRIRSM